MSENLKTIRELAEELGVSKKKIHYQVSKLDTDLIQRLDGTIYLDKSAISKIKSSIGYIPPVELDTSGIQNRHKLDSVLDTEKNKLIDEKSEQISYLKEQLNKKDDQLSIKDEQIKSLVEIQSQTQNLLDQQQRLALQDKKLLEEYKAEIKDLKALAMPSREDEKDVSHQSETEPAEAQAQAKPTKWWQFRKRGQKKE
ncbi:DNA-binding protein [Leuconostoc falkenbergense]|uniref:DNA-binding protein n=1 Tax=Leuconostoc falkenbergense TaxID=2766470 RepID=UPI0021AAF37E|nr:DNA-binding protein [Leuconostoc falkenbergense]MCT4403859.1 DNA-binding protein [Leuconostoc falkenbergense]